MQSYSARWLARAAGMAVWRIFGQAGLCVTGAMWLAHFSISDFCNGLLGSGYSKRSQCVCKSVGTNRYFFWRICLRVVPVCILCLADGRLGRDDWLDSSSGILVSGFSWRYLGAASSVNSLGLAACGCDYCGNRFDIYLLGYRWNRRTVRNHRLTDHGRPDLFDSVSIFGLPWRFDSNLDATYTRTSIYALAINDLGDLVCNIRIGGSIND